MLLSVNALNNVLLPTFGKPTIPISKAISNHLNITEVKRLAVVDDSASVQVK